MGTTTLSTGEVEPVGPGCERLGDGALAEPVAALSSLAFVLAALVVLARPARAARHPGGDHAAPLRDRRLLLPYAALVAGVGLGSFVQHGPDPAWSDVAHDLPLVGTLALVAADSWAGLTRRPRRWARWRWPDPATTLAVTAVVVAAVMVVVVLAPTAGDLAQVGVAVVAVGLTAARARAVPATRRRTVVAIGLLAVGALVGTLSRTGGPLCDPDSPWQGHAGWHLLAAVALVVLAPTLGRRAGRGGAGVS